MNRITITLCALISAIFCAPLAAQGIPQGGATLVEVRWDILPPADPEHWVFAEAYRGRHFETPEGLEAWAAELGGRLILEFGPMARISLDEYSAGEYILHLAFPASAGPIAFIGEPAFGSIALMRGSAQVLDFGPAAARLAAPPRVGRSGWGVRPAFEAGLHSGDLFAYPSLGLELRAAGDGSSGSLSFALNAAIGYERFGSGGSNSNAMLDFALAADGGPEFPATAYAKASYDLDASKQPSAEFGVMWAEDSFLGAAIPWSIKTSASYDSATTSSRLENVVAIAVVDMERIEGFSRGYSFAASTAAGLDLDTGRGDAVLSMDGAYAATIGTRLAVRASAGFSLSTEEKGDWATLLRGVSDSIDHPVALAGLAWSGEVMATLARGKLFTRDELPVHVIAAAFHDGAILAPSSAALSADALRLCIGGEIRMSIDTRPRDYLRLSGGIDLSSFVPGSSRAGATTQPEISAVFGLFF